MKQRLHHTCTVMRRKLRRHGKLTDGEIQFTHEEWVTEPCGSPLFSGDDEIAGVCRSCKSGWSHPNNYPVKVKP